MNAKVRLLRPTNLEPQSETDVVVGYENISEKPHHINSITLTPTWNPENNSEFSTDKVIFPDTQSKISLNQVPIPRGIVGKQGFKLDIQVTEAYDGEGADYTIVSAGPIRKEVAESTELHSICYVGGDTSAASATEFIENWSFQYDKISEPEEFRRKYDTDEVTPVCVFCIVRSTDDLDVSRRVISDAIDRGIWPIVLTDSQVNSDGLANECILIEADLNSIWDIEKSGSKALHSFRINQEVGLLDPLIDRLLRKAENSPEWFFEESKRLTRNAPIHIFEGILTHIFLKGTGGYEKIDELLGQQTKLEREAEDELPNDVINLTESPEQDSQIVHVIPFDGTHRIWQWKLLYGDGRAQQLEYGREVAGNSAFQNAVEYGLLPKVNTHVETKWFPNARSATGGIQDKTGERTIHRSSRTSGLKLNLPAEGVYTFSSISDKSDNIYNTRGSWISFEDQDSIGRGHFGNLAKVIGDKSDPSMIKTGIPISIKPSVPRFDEDRTQIAWYWD